MRRTETNTSILRQSIVELAQRERKRERDASNSRRILKRESGLLKEALYKPPALGFIVKSPQKADATLGALNLRIF